MMHKGIWLPDNLVISIRAEEELSSIGLKMEGIKPFQVHVILEKDSLGWTTSIGNTNKLVVKDDIRPPNMIVWYSDDLQSTILCGIPFKLIVMPYLF